MKTFKKQVIPKNPLIRIRTIIEIRVNLRKIKNMTYNRLRIIFYFRKTVLETEGSIKNKTRQAVLLMGLKPIRIYAKII